MSEKETSGNTSSAEPETKACLVGVMKRSIRVFYGETVLEKALFSSFTGPKNLSNKMP